MPTHRPLHPRPAVRIEPPRLLRWSPLLRKLAGAGPFWAECPGSGVVLSQRLLPQSLWERGDLAVIEGEGGGLHCFLRHWRAASLVPEDLAQGEPPLLQIRDAAHRPLLNCLVDSSGDAMALSAVCASGAQAEAGPPRSGPGLHDWGELSELMQRAPGGPACRAGLECADVAEACGWLKLGSKSPCARWRVTVVEPQPVPCLLEGISYQSVPTQVVTGTAGVVSRFTGAFHTFRRCEGGWLSLIAEEARLGIDLAAIATALVLERPCLGRPRHQVRLYDAAGRALLLVEDHLAAPSHGGAIWRVLTDVMRN